MCIDYILDNSIVLMLNFMSVIRYAQECLCFLEIHGEVLRDVII